MTAPRLLAIVLALTAAISIAGCSEETNPATNVTATSARLNGTLTWQNGEGRGEFWWEYSKDNGANWSATAHNAFGTLGCSDPSGTCSLPVSKDIGGLTPSSHYIFRLAGWTTVNGNRTGTVYGDSNWTSSSDPDPPYEYDSFDTHAVTPWINPSTGNPYHWARTVNPFTVNLGSDVTSAWTSSLAGASTDWSSYGALTDYFGTFTTTNPLRATVVAGLTTGRKCWPRSGRVEVCDAGYGNNGWLGLATIWASGDHITQGTVKLNDTYFGSGSSYNTPIWRASVTCQEVGHTFGLDHQDTSGANFHTCMDYASVPDSWNTHPNRYDYSTLETDYAHLDSTSTLAATTTSSGGHGLRRLRDDLYVENLGRGNRRFVWVFWANRSVRHSAPDEADIQPSR